MTTPNKPDKPPEVFTVESYRYEMDPEQNILAWLIGLGHKIVELERSHSHGARVSAVIVEMERPN